MKKLRKFLVVGVMALTAIGMSGLTVNTAKASASAGDLIKMAGNSSVYYLGSDSKRYVFPNSTTYFSWYPDFSGVITIPASELQSYALGGNVTMRPGTKLVKITTDPSVYAVEPNGALRKIQSEAQASALYGTNWSKRVVDVPDAFFTNYTVGTALTSGTFPVGSLVKNASGASVYYYDGTNYRTIANEAAFNANRFQWGNVLTTTSTVTAGGTAVSTAEFVNVAQNGGNSNPANTGSGVMVSLSSDTPAAMTVPSNATQVPFTKVNLTASNDGDTVINGIVVKRTGVGASTDISKVYIYDGSTRLGSGRTISASTNEATFTNLGLVITKGTTKTLTITADIANGVSGNHALSVASASAITTGGANVSGSFPASGNIMSLSSTTVGKMDVESNGSAYTRKVGETEVELANFSVYTNNVEDSLFKSITLYNSGRDVISNLKLYRGSDLVATGVQNGNYFNFTLVTPYLVEKSQSASFTVKGDVSGRLNDTATLYVRYNTDVIVTGKTYGYNLAADQTLGGTNNKSYIEEAGTTYWSNTTTVQAGQLTAAFVGPNTGNVAKNTSNVELLNFNLTSQAAVDVSKMIVTISGNGSLNTTDIDNLDLVIDGVVVSTKAAVTVGDNTFTDTFTLPAGRTVVGKVLVDINSTAAGDETIAAAVKDLTSAANFVAKTADGDTVSDIIPSGNISGKTQTVLGASLAINLSSTPASGVSYVKGTTNIPVAGFSFSAGTATDVKITSIKLTAYLDDANTDFSGGAEKIQTSGAKNVISTVSIYDGTTLVGTKKALTVGTSDITVTFDGLGLIIPKGTTKNIVAKVDTANNLNSDNDDAIALTIATAGNVIAEYGSGTNLVPSLSSDNNTPSIYQKITTGGTLTVGLASDTPLKSNVLSGATEVPYTKVKLSATKEDFNVDKLEITNSGNDSNFAAIGISYLNAAGATVKKTQTLVAGKANFNDLDIFVAKDSDAYVTVYGDMNTVSAGATNGNASTLTAEFDSNFQATGKSSGDVETSPEGADAVGASMALYEAVPTVVFASNTPSGTLIPSINTHVARINIANSGTKSITLDDTAGNTSKLTVNLSATGAGLINADDTVTVKDKNGTTLCTTATFNLGTTAAFDCLFDSAALTIGANSTEYVDVYVDTTELSAQGNTIQASLAPTAANFTWGINGAGAFATGDINFRGTLNGGSLVKP